MQSKRGFHLRDIIFLALIGILFGVIYYGGDFIYNAHGQRPHNGPMVHGGAIGWLPAQTSRSSLHRRISGCQWRNVPGWPMGCRQPDFRFCPRDCHRIRFHLHCLPDLQQIYGRRRNAHHDPRHFRLGLVP